MIFKEIEWTPEAKATHEEIPQEELWEDGELNETEVRCKVLYRVLDKGDWLIIRKKNNGN